MSRPAFSVHMTSIAVPAMACVFGMLAGPAPAQDAAAKDAQPIIVIAPGGGMDADDALNLDAQELRRTGTADLIGALQRTFAGVTVQDAQNNPWQPNLVYRGFVASPLQGQAQGLAVYLDGARFNQPFGDTVPFDLIPDAALRAAKLFDASPVYGLNALGGALALTTRTGRTDRGFEASVSHGHDGLDEAEMAGGGSAGELSLFGAVQYRHDRGWRDHSPSTLYNGYADIGIDSDEGGLHVKYVGADTDLTGNGVAPVELLAARRGAVYTWPDNSRAGFARFSLHPWAALSDTTRIEASLYAQRLTLRTVNGDAADIAACDDAGHAGWLCLEPVADDGSGSTDEESVLTDSHGVPIADVLGGGGYGLLNRGRTRTEAAGLLAQIADDRPLAGGINHLELGLSYDSSRTDFNAATELGALTADRSVEGLGPGVAQPDNAIAPIALRAHTRYWGVFVQDRLPLGAGLSAELGLRYNAATIRLDDRIGTALNGEHHFRRLNPGIELDWQASPVLTLRAGYSEANRAPTPAELSCADPQAPCSLANFFVADPPLAQVVARSLELGGSGTIASGSWQLRWLLSAYRTTNSDDIHHVASDIRGRAYFRNIGTTRRQGLEATLRARRGNLAIEASYTLTDATFRNPLDMPSPANPLADNDGVIHVRPGNRLPGIPRHSMTLQADYAGTIGGARRFSVGADLTGRSSQFLLGDEANQNAPIPGYVVVNLRAAFDLLPAVTLFGVLRNAFDRHYATFGTFSDLGDIPLAEAPGASDPRAYGPGAPRRWLVGLKTRF